MDITQPSEALKLSKFELAEQNAKDLYVISCMTKMARHAYDTIIDAVRLNVNSSFFK